MYYFNRYHQTAKPTKIAKTVGDETIAKKIFEAREVGKIKGGRPRNTRKEVGTEGETRGMNCVEMERLVMERKE